MGLKKRNTWFDRVMKDRLNLLKKIAIYGTLVLWAGIWFATRGEEKPSIGKLFEDISNTWMQKEGSNPPVIK